MVQGEQKGYDFIQPYSCTLAVKRARLSSLNEGVKIGYEEMSKHKTTAEDLRVG